MTKKKCFLQKKEESQRENRMEMEKQIPEMARMLIALRKKKGTLQFPSAQLSAYPAEYHAMILSSVIASDALYYYTKKDGDPHLYIAWFLEAALSLLNEEFKTEEIRENDILANPMNFYEKMVQIMKIKKPVSILPMRDHYYFQKIEEIYEEREQ